MNTRALLIGTVLVGLLVVPARATDFGDWLTGQTWAGSRQRYDDRAGRWVECPGSAFLVTFEPDGRCHVLRGGPRRFAVCTSTRWVESEGGIVVADLSGRDGGRNVELLLRAAYHDGTLEASSVLVVRADCRERF